MYSFVHSIFPVKKTINCSVLKKLSNSLGKKNRKIQTRTQSLLFASCSLNFLDASVKKSTRLKTDDTVQSIINSLQIVSDEKKFFDFCVINREHLSYSLLYRLSALKLKAESESNVQTKSKNIDDFRKKILENILFIDQTVSQGLIVSEKRIKEIMESSLDEKVILQKIPNDPTSISCFWIVLYSAITAWEKKETNEAIVDSSEIYRKLKKIQMVFVDSQVHQSSLAYELIFLQNLLENKSDVSWSSKKHYDLIEGIKILILQLEKLPSNSYGPLLKKLLKICNQVLAENMGTKVENFDNFKITFPLTNIETESKLIEIQKNST